MRHAEVVVTVEIDGLEVFSGRSGMPVPLAVATRDLPDVLDAFVRCAALKVLPTLAVRDHDALRKRLGIEVDRKAEGEP